jgi:protocatechuate 3,4-dioxygenase beta subunit
MTWLICVLLLQGFSVPAAPPQTRQAPASLEGVVRRIGTGEPVPNARLVLSGGATPNQRAATSDTYGRFTFTGLEPGRYSLTAFANNYARLAYGQKTPNGPPTPIVLAAGQQVKDLLFDMTPTAIVTGRVYDFNNVPLANADVVLQKRAYDETGQRTLQTVQQARTNDLGEYRLFWVSPGTYFLRVEYTGAGFPGFPMMRSPNEFRGPVEEGYAPLYYPGTSDPSAAKELELVPGAQLSAIDINMVRTKTYTVRGRAIVPTGNPAMRPFVSLRSRLPGGAAMNSNGASMNPDGTFEIRNVPAGSYVLTANAGNPSSGMLRAEKRLEIQQDLEGVTMTLSWGFDLTGRVVFEKPPDSNANFPGLTAMRVSLRPVEPGLGMVGMGMVGGPPTIKPDGTFVVPQVIPGTYQVLISPMAPNNYIKTVVVGGADARDGFTLDRPPDSPIEVLVGANAGRLEGTVLDREGQPAAGAQITLIPLENTRSDRYRVSNTDQNGHFTLRGIIPGAYKAFAWDSLEPNAYRDPELIRRFDNQGKAVAVIEGSNASIELRLVRP